MSDDNVLDVKELFGKFKSIVELKDYTRDIFLRLQVSIKKLQEQEQELAHLRTLLSSNAFELIPPEQLTCEMEIRKFENVSKSRHLTLEEAKIFDIMNKNLLAIKRAKQEEKRPIKTIEEDELTLLGIVNEQDNKEPSGQ